MRETDRVDRAMLMIALSFSRRDGVMCVSQAMANDDHQHVNRCTQEMPSCVWGGGLGLKT